MKSIEPADGVEAGPAADVQARNDVATATEHIEVIKAEHTIPVAHSSDSGGITLKSDLLQHASAPIASVQSQQNEKHENKQFEHHLSREELNPSSNLPAEMPPPVPSEQSEAIVEEHTSPVTHKTGREQIHVAEDLPALVPLPIKSGSSEGINGADINSVEAGSEQLILTTDLSTLVPPSVPSAHSDAVLDEDISPVVHDTGFLESIPASIEPLPAHDSPRATESIPASAAQPAAHDSPRPSKRSSDGTMINHQERQEALTATPMEGVESLAENSTSHNAEVPLNVQNAITADDLDVDSNISDTDSAVGDVNIPSSTVSLRSSIYDMVEENGRTYHRYKEGKYMLPNDELEQERLDLQHHLFVLTLSGSLHLAPLNKGVQDVLDIGTGTGIWAIEFATSYPSARVIGTDLSPIQPVYVPPNCSFEVDDAEDPWIFSHKFDYIHGRLLVTCFQNFPAVVGQCLDFLKPGGYMELQDVLPFACYDDSWDGSSLQQLVKLLVEGGTKLGVDWFKAGKYKSYMMDKGFEDVHEVHFAWPSNSRWPKGAHYKNLGRWNHQNMLDGIQGISMGILTRVHGWSKQEVDVFMVAVKKDFADRNIHAYLPVRVVYGRKPR